MTRYYGATRRGVLALPALLAAGSARAQNRPLQVVVPFPPGGTSDLIARLEPHYLVMRGREAGSGEDGRAFFVPYEDICFMKIDRIVNGNELRRMYGETVALDFNEQMIADNQPAPATAANPAPTAATTASTVSGSDPASIAKQNLLARIRAARTTGGSPAK